MNESFNQLNKYQQEAVKRDDRFLLLNASVGSGKTTVLIQKILFLYQSKKIPLKDMVVLTFTNKAAEEIKERLIDSDNGDIDRRDLSLFGTFHSVARYLLSNVLPVETLGYTKDFTVVDQNGMEELFDSIINSYDFDIRYRKKLEKRFHAFKNGRILYGNMRHEDDMEKFMGIVQEEKIKRNLMDFDDLIENASKLLHLGGYRPSYVIIDEFQDTDSAQLEFIDGLIGGNTSVFAVGDPNQVIYSWRGSSSNIFKIFKERYNAVEKSLPVNYRSTGTIIEAAKAFLNNPQSLEGIRGKGASIVVKRHYNSFNEALYLADTIKNLHKNGTLYKDIAIFYRMQKQSDVFEDVFKKKDIPYEVSVRKALKDIPVLYWIVRLIKASLNDRDTDSLMYVIKDDRYGFNLSSKQAHKLLKETDMEGKTILEPLVSKIRGFKGWCSAALVDGLENKIYKYFDLDNYISPTSIYYEEEKNIINKYLGELKKYIQLNEYSVAEGVKRAIDYSILYGSGVINEIIDPEEESVKLMTLHASKGLEFKHVFISGANMGIIPLGARYDDEEEKRLFFVGITRAKDYLEISYHSNPDIYRALPLPSPYLSMIPDELIESEEIKSRAHKLSDLRKEIRSNMEGKVQDMQNKKKIVRHPKYGEGYVILENDETYTVMFEGYGEKSFSKLFSPLNFVE